MAKWHKGAGKVSGSNQKWMTVNKTTNTREGVPVRLGENKLIKGNTKLKWTTFDASLPHSCFSKHQFQDERLSLYLLSNRWYTGRERGGKRVFCLMVFLRDGELPLGSSTQKQMVFLDPPLRSPSLLLLLEQPTTCGSAERPRSAVAAAA